jgi:hypothetical protein
LVFALLKIFFIKIFKIKSSTSSESRIKIGDNHCASGSVLTKTLEHQNNLEQRHRMDFR